MFTHLYKFISSVSWNGGGSSDRNNKDWGQKKLKFFHVIFVFSSWVSKSLNLFVLLMSFQWTCHNLMMPISLLCTSIKFFTHYSQWWYYILISQRAIHLANAYLGAPKKKNAEWIKLFFFWWPCISLNLSMLLPPL